MKTKLFSLLLALLASSATMFAASGTCGNNLTWDYKEGVLTITGNGPMTNYSGGKTPWASFESSILSVIINEGVTSIGNSAFSNCVVLNSVTIPNSVTRIGDWAFYNCTSLKSVTIPYGVIGIYQNAFNGCTSLTSITIPNSVKGIGDLAFADCTSLTSLTFPSSITSVGTKIVYNCNKLTSVTINSTTLLNNSLYSSTNNLQSLLTGSRITRCIIGEEVTSIGNYAFATWTDLTSVVIGSSVTSIGEQAFYGCTGLTSITIPDGVTTIGKSAFCGCTGLTSLNVGRSLTSIGEQCFSNCGHVRTVYWDAENYVNRNSYSPLGGTAMSSITFGQHVVHIPSYLCSGFSISSIIIPDNVESMGSYAFAGSKNLTSITIGKNVKSWALGALSKCENLQSVQWNAVDCKDFTARNTPFYYKQEPFMTFDNDFDIRSQIKSFTIGKDVEHIPANVCSELTNIQKVDIPNKTKSIGEAAFSYCKNLTTVTIGNTLQSIGKSAFVGCSSIASIVIPNCVKEIGDMAFAGCHNLSSAQIGDGVISTGNYTFEGCEKLKTIILGNNIESIGIRAFYGCGSLCSIEIPNNVKKIGARAFAWSHLMAIVLPNHVTNIGEEAFANCQSLSTVTCMATTCPTLGDSVYEGISCNKIPLYVPEESITAYRRAAQWCKFSPILPIEYADSTEISTVTATQTETDNVLIAWPAENDANTYIVEIRKGEEIICIFVFNSKGQLISSHTAHSRERKVQKTGTAIQAASGWQYEITDLELEVEYNCSVIAKDSHDNVLYSKTVTFAIRIKDGIEDIHVGSDKPAKVLMDGQIYILRGEKVYDAEGKMVR